MKIDVGRVKEYTLPQDLSSTACGKNHFRWAKRLKVLKAQHFNVAHAMYVLSQECERLESRIMEANEQFVEAKKVTDGR